MKKDPKIFLEHILQCIEHIEEYVEGITKRGLPSLHLRQMPAMILFPRLYASFSHTPSNPIKRIGHSSANVASIFLQL